jgi:hypothetical protein
MDPVGVLCVASDVWVRTISRNVTTVKNLVTRILIEEVLKIYVGVSLTRKTPACEAGIEGAVPSPQPIFNSISTRRKNAKIG